MNTEQDDDVVWVGWNTIYVGPHAAVQLKPTSLLELIKEREQAEIELEQSIKDHPEDCGWWQDWHQCSCGLFDVK